MDHVYILPEFKIASLNEVLVQVHSQESPPGSRNDTPTPKIISLELDMALFSDAENEDVQTWILRQNTGLYTSCTCGAQIKKMCRHQTAALLALCRRLELRSFFDVDLRREKLKHFAMPYGLQDEEDLDQYFRLTYADGQIAIRPVSPHLVPLGRDHAPEQWEPRKSGTGLRVPPAEQRLILIFRPHKYYKHLTIELAEAAFTQKGKPKNPIRPAEAIERLWTTDTPEESKFFSAVQFFQNKATNDQPDQSLKALRAILKNPFNIPFFSHDGKRSGNITASSLQPLETGSPVNNLQLRVKPKQPFYEITAELNLNERKFSLDQVHLLHDYFISDGQTAFLIGNTDLLQAITFMKQYGGKLWIHESRYEDFREQVLLRLEERNPVDYTYLSPATAEQLKAFQFDRPPEKFLYLTDAGAYVELSPVMKYGDVEIPILSKRQIHSRGIKTGFVVDRDQEEEIAFTSLIMRQHPHFYEQLDEQLPYFYLHKKHFLDESWFLEAFDEWRKRGIRIFGFNKIRNNPLNPHKARITIRFLSGTDWFNAEMDVRFGSKRASMRLIQKAVRNKTKYVRLDDGTVGILPEEWLSKFREYFNAGEIDRNGVRIPKINYAKAIELAQQDSANEAVTSEFAVLEAEMAALTEDLIRLENGIAELEILQEAEIPPGLQTTLRPYQRQGLSWLNFLDDHGFGGCLADDMGLGKTIQIIAFILMQRTKRPGQTSLLLVPTSLVFNWIQEIKKFAPTLNVHSHYGPGRRADTTRFAGNDLVITTYGTLLSDLNFLKNFTFNYLFADESQNIKNPDSQRHRAACMLQARNRIAITGTPIENNTFDLFGQLRFACPGLLGSLQYFREVYALPIDQFGDRKRASELQQKVRPFILRRTKEQVARELPEKTEIVLRCEMHPRQQLLYDRIEREFREYICSKTDEELPGKSVHVLKGLLRLRQICNSPLLLNDDEIDIWESGKMDLLMDQLLSKAPHHKILVFSQFVSMLNLVERELGKHGIGVSRLTGSTRNRKDVVQTFQSDPAKRIFLISLKAGGTGLNLTQADYVYLVDPWWNPAVENQAIDRVYRIGQTRRVVAVRLVCAGSIEEKILHLQQSKRELFDNLIAKENLLELLGEASGLVPT